MFVHLHCHSQYSFLRAVPAPEELVAAAAERAMPAVALTDTNGLYAAVPFYLAARKAGIKPIVGALLDVALDIENNARRGTPPVVSVVEPCRAPTSGTATGALILLAADLTGYSNLCWLITQRHLADRPLTLDDLAQHAKGLVALVRPEPHPSLPPTCSGQRITDNGTQITTLRDIFADALYLEVQHLSPGDGRALREAARFSRELRVPLVATNNVHFIRRDEHLHHRVLNAIRTGGLLTTVAPPEITSSEAYFKSAEEMQRLFADHPEALAATAEIAARCHLELALGKTIFPEFPVPAGETPFSYLWKLCFDGARRRYQPLRPEVLARLTHELEVIERLHLAPYFLLVWDIVEEARRRGIPAVARGSAASSIVTYCLGISRICPLRWELYFERFLNAQRGDIPDIDLDICGARRDELLDYVYHRWGQQHVAPGGHGGDVSPRVAMISSFVTMHARLAVREVAKVFGLSPGEVNHFTRRLPHRPVSEILEAIRTLPQCRALPAQEEPWRTILDVALRLDGFPRHLGIHPCGIVIAARPLTEHVPLEIATKGIVVTQYDMNAIEALGLIKMDLLGQRGLTTMSLALDGIARATAEHAPGEGAHQIDFDAIPEGDPATCEMLSQGRTMGIFQIESPGMRGLLRTLRARTLRDICLALALIRPGASEYGSKESFLKRLRGQEPVRYAHPAMEKILGETLGVCVYQEQVMQLAQAVGAMSLAEADLVRRSTAKFADQRERDRLRAKFLKAAAQRGLEGRELEQTWQMVEKFAGFGFCKAHAATYADISYRIAYLKAHHPAEFLAAMCSSGAGFYHVSAYVEEAKRWGIEVRLPSVNHSRLEYTTEPAGETPRAIRIGLMQVKGLRLETIQHIVASREKDGPYRSLENFLARVPVERDEIESLIKCGALDDIGQQTALTRPALLWQWNALRASLPRVQPAEMLFPDAVPPAAEPVATPAADYSREQRMAYEQEILEVCVTGHPLDLIPRNGENWSDDLERARPGQRVTLLGWLVTYRHVGTKDYRNMMFVTLEDQRGLFEAVLFPEAYERYGGLVYETRTLRVTGRLEPGGQINCEKMEIARRNPQETFESRPAYRRRIDSRDPSDFLAEHPNAE